MSLDDSNNQFVRHIVQHERRIYGYILSLVPNWTDADEILQETFVRLWEEFDKFEPGTSFPAWAMRVAYFQVLTWRKRIVRDRHHFFDRDVLDALSEVHTARSEEIDARYGMLAKCIEGLTERNRDLLARCYNRGARVKQVAAELGRSTEAVYKALQRVRMTLHRCIDRRLAEEATS
jgi:RNA polymerase sigma-70 factor, ECF subfamily